MLKRSFDFTASFLGLIITLPFLLFASLLVFLQDFRNPLYFGKRIGKDGKSFWMIKIRSMITNADKTGVESTSDADNRITTVGRIIRKAKLDEFSQLFNVVSGDMSLVGPRPNTEKGVSDYSTDEIKLLSVRPGITDFASIVFADEGEILKDSKDPDGDYNALIRPWKSKLGLLYIQQQSFMLDIKLILLTLLNFVSRKSALSAVYKMVLRLSGDTELSKVCLREGSLG